MAKVMGMFRLDEEVKRAAEDAAKREGRSLSNLFAFAVQSYLEQKGYKLGRRNELGAENPAPSV